MNILSNTLDSILTMLSMLFVSGALVLLPGSVILIYLKIFWCISVCKFFGCISFANALNFCPLFLITGKGFANKMKGNY